MTALRNATENDIPRITGIYAHYVRTSVATFEEVPPDAAEMTARFRRLTGLGLTWLVGEDDPGVQGYAYAAPFRARSACRFAVEDPIYIDPGRVGGGYGTQLLSALIARCEALGKRQMIAVVGGSKSAESIACIAGWGFVSPASCRPSDINSAIGWIRFS